MCGLGGSALLDLLSAWTDLLTMVFSDNWGGVGGDIYPSDLVSGYINVWLNVHFSVCLRSLQV